MEKYKNKLYIILILLVISLLSACGGPSNQLKIALDIEDKGRYDELFEYFQEQTGIEIAATYGEDIGKLVGTRNEPDIIKTSTVVISSMKDSLYDLSSLIEQDDEINVNDYLEEIMKALSIAGKVYALPTSINTSLLYYNKTLFNSSAAALKVAFNLSENDDIYPKADWTYEDYQKAGVVLSKYTINGQNRTYTQFGAETQLNWWGEWLVYVNQMGGSFFEKDSNNRISALNSPEAIAATQFYVNKSMGTVNQKFAPDAIEAAASFSFLNGNVAMIFGGHMGDWYSYDLIGLDWGIQVLPTPVGNENAKGGEVSADAFGISVRSRKVNEAFTFLKLWTGETGARQMYKYGKIGALKNMGEIIASLPQEEQKNVDVEVVFKALEKAVTLPNEKDFSKVCREIVMSDLYKLFYTGRGSETDVEMVLNRIKVNVDKYYRELYQ